MHIIIEFCTANMLKGTDTVFDELSNNHTVDVLDYGCLNDCGLCSNTLFALVNGTPVSARNADRLLDKIHKKIEQIEIAEEADFNI